MSGSPTDVLPAADEQVTEADGLAHYVRIKALMVGGPVTALCGKRYVPTVIAQAADRELCEKCAYLMELLRMMYGDA